MLKLGVLVSGGGTNLQALIDACAVPGFPAEVAAVVSSRSKAYAVERAEKHGIPCRVILKKDFAETGTYETEIIKYFNAYDVGLVITAGFMTILDKGFVEYYENRMINIHPALVPSFCGKGFYGLRVHEAALEKGVKVTGATVQFAVEEADAGPIILQKAVEVKDGDTPETLQKRVMAEAEWIILPEAVRLFAEGRITVEDGRARITQEGDCGGARDDGA
jgi:phosphoribosylglycinamide formyltransferase-1